MKPIYSTTEDQERDFHRGDDKMQHYRVPEGYMEGLSEHIMACIATEAACPVATPPVSWWTKLKPSLYLAASFVGIFLAFKGVMLLQPQTGEAEIIAESEMGDDAYFRYYEDYAGRIEGDVKGRELLLDASI